MILLGKLFELVVWPRNKLIARTPHSSAALFRLLLLKPAQHQRDKNVQVLQASLGTGCCCVDCQTYCNLLLLWVARKQCSCWHFANQWINSGHCNIIENHDITTCTTLHVLFADYCQHPKIKNDEGQCVCMHPWVQNSTGGCDCPEPLVEEHHFCDCPYPTVLTSGGECEQCPDRHIVFLPNSKNKVIFCAGAAALLWPVFLRQIQ